MEQVSQKTTEFLLIFLLFWSVFVFNFGILVRFAFKTVLSKSQVLQSFNNFFLLFFYFFKFCQKWSPFTRLKSWNQNQSEKRDESSEFENISSFEVWSIV